MGDDRTILNSVVDPKNKTTPQSTYLSIGEHIFEKIFPGIGAPENVYHITNCHIKRDSEFLWKKTHMSKMFSQRNLN